MIKGIKIHNFGIFADTESINTTVTEDRNIVLIVGDNGAGKTTLFNAVKFALYGRRDDGTREHSDPFQTENRDGMTYVEIDFEHNGKEYKIRRSIQFKQTDKTSITWNPTLEIFEEGVSFMTESANTESDRQDWINDILPIDQSQFFFWESKYFDLFFKCELDNTKYLFENFLGVDSKIKYENTMSKIQEYASDMLHRLQNKRSYCGIEIDHDFHVKAILDDNSKTSISCAAASEVVLFTFVLIYGYHQCMEKNMPIIIDGIFDRMDLSTRHDLLEGISFMKEQIILFTQPLAYAFPHHEEKNTPDKSYPSRPIQRIRSSLASEWEIKYVSKETTSQIVKIVAHL